jgi:bacillithiol biosynthesis cysteine-adding enzyme BshC
MKNTTEAIKLLKFSKMQVEWRPKIKIMVCFVIQSQSELFPLLLDAMYDRLEIPFSEVPQLSQRDVLLQEEEDRFSGIIKHKASIDSFDEAIKMRAQCPVRRDVLVETLDKQYQGRLRHEAVDSNIQLLGYENTFTIVTAHQPSMLTGPLYVIYKICSAIQLTTHLKEQYPTYHFVPCFISGGEDHDFEEIATIQLWNQSFSWETHQKGAVGRMTMDGIPDLLTTLYERFGESDHAKDLREKIEVALTGCKTYGEFSIKFIHELFKDKGLVIINMDDALFKSLFLKIAEKELREGFSQPLVNQDQEELARRGFASQAHAREINLFLHNEDRHRIIRNENGDFNVGEKTYDQEEFIDLVVRNPESLSPNVVLRPVYQELILPNLAYVGGGGELAYWTERISLFRELGIPFPMLIRRDSFLIVDKRSYSFCKDQGIDIRRLFDREEQLVNSYIKEDSDTTIHLEDLKPGLQAIFQEIANRAREIDVTLTKTVLSEGTKAEKSIDYLQGRLLKAEKKKKEVTLNKITTIKHRLFPNNGLQERNDNFIQYYLRYGTSWIDAILDHSDPMNKQFKILVEE